MLIGAHVRTGGSLLGALDRARVIGADVVQVFTQSPRMWKPSQYGPEALAAYREAQTALDSVVATYCHASYLVNLATPDAVLFERSKATLLANLKAARGMGASGLVLHAGSHLGRGFDPVAGQVVDALLFAIDAAVDPVAGPVVAGTATGTVTGPPLRTATTPGEGTATKRGDLEVATPCPILLENVAGSGGSVGRNFEELAVLLERADAGDSLGVCLDTQHLWASGIPFTSPFEADDVVAAFDATVGLAALRCLHLNDSKTPFGAKVDRHANLGEGTIGEKSLGWLIGHPLLARLPAILEVAGAGNGPRAEDIAGARRILAAGQGLWEEAWGFQGGVSGTSGAAAEWVEPKTKEER